MSMEIKEELLDIEGIKNSKKPLIDLFIRRTAVITSTQETLTEKIIKDQWQKANLALGPTTDIQEVDFCNLGTFKMSPGKARRRIEKLEAHNKAISEHRTEDLKKTYTRAEKILLNEGIINTIKRKTKQPIDEHQTYFGRN